MSILSLFVCVGVTAGAIGSFIGTPAEISLIRMTSDGRSVSKTCTGHMTLIIAHDLFPAIWHE